MADIYDYLRTILLHSDATPSIFNRWMRKEEAVANIESSLSLIVDQQKVADLIDIRTTAQRFYEEILAKGCINILDEDFAGLYFLGNIEKYNEYKKKDEASNRILARSKAVGKRFYPDVFSGYRSKYASDKMGLPILGNAPGSDRIVRFSDNQVSELDDGATRLIEVLSEQNQIDGIAGLRELMLGQLRAGRELIRAGSARLYILQITLIESLRFLVRRYEGELIGGLAASLITALVKHLGIDA